MLLGQLALVDAALFAGAATFISYGEHPSRLDTDDSALLIQFKGSYTRGAQMQAPLAVIGGILGLLQWLIYGGLFWLWGAIFIFANVPYTFAFIMPLNKQLMAMTPKTPNVEGRSLIQQWGQLHMNRTWMGLAATLFFFFASLF